MSWARRKPLVLPRCHIPPVEKHSELLLAQLPSERLDLRMVAPVVAEKDIEVIRRHRQR